VKYYEEQWTKCITDRPKWFIGRYAHKYFPEWKAVCRAKIHSAALLKIQSSSNERVTAHVCHEELSPVGATQ
jgi:hypothetical protein